MTKTKKLKNENSHNKEDIFINATLENRKSVMDDDATLCNKKEQSDHQKHKSFDIGM